MKTFLKENLLSAKLIKLAPYLLLFLIFIFIWKLNQLTPLWGDDYCRIATSTSIFEALNKAVDRYLTLNGRFFVHIINYLVFGNYPASLKYFNFINALSFIGLIFLIFVIAFGRKPKELRDVIYILFIFTLIFVGAHGIGEVALWKTGSIGYLWGVNLELIFLLPFFWFFRGWEFPSFNKLSLWGFYLVSFIAATFIEHLSFAISAIVLLTLLVQELRKQEIPNYLKTSCTLHILGSATLIFSKGNFLKSSFQIVPPLNENILGNFALVDPIIKGGLGWILLFSLILALTNRSFINAVKKSIIWPIFSIAALTLLIFTLLPTDQPFVFRIAFPFEIFMIIGITHLSSYFPKISLFDITLFLILLVSILGHGVTAYKNQVSINQQVSERDTLISALKVKGQERLELDRITLPNIGDYGSEYVSKYIYISDVTENANHWKNVCFAQAFDLKEVISNP